MSKPFKDLNVCDDYMFTAVFSHERICIAILEKILDIQIESLTYLESQKTLDPNKDSKSVRLDVYVKDDKGESYNIEMQTSHNDNLLKRARYYQGMMDRDSLDKGSKVKYDNLNKSYIIFICTFDPFKKGHYLYQFERICTSDHSVKETDDTIHLFLNTKGKTNDIDKELIALLKYIENSTNTIALESNSDLVHKLNDLVQSIKNDKKENQNYMTLADRYDEKFEEGVIEGRMAEKLELAKAFLDLADDDTIALKTGLPIETVKQLRAELKK